MREERNYLKGGNTPHPAPNLPNSLKKMNASGEMVVVVWGRGRGAECENENVESYQRVAAGGAVQHEKSE